MDLTQLNCLSKYEHTKISVSVRPNAHINIIYSQFSSWFGIDSWLNVCFFWWTVINPKMLIYYRIRWSKVANPHKWQDATVRNVFLIIDLNDRSIIDQWINQIITFREKGNGMGMGWGWDGDGMGMGWEGPLSQDRQMVEPGHDGGLWIMVEDCDLGGGWSWMMITTGATRGTFCTFVCPGRGIPHSYFFPC